MGSGEGGFSMIAFRQSVSQGVSEACLYCEELPKSKNLDGTLRDFCSKECGDEANARGKIL